MDKEKSSYNDAWEEYCKQYDYDSEEEKRKRSMEHSYLEIQYMEMYGRCMQKKIKESCFIECLLANIFKELLETYSKRRMREIVERGLDWAKRKYEIENDPDEIAETEKWVKEQMKKMEKRKNEIEAMEPQEGV